MTTTLDDAALLAIAPLAGAEDRAWFARIGREWITANGWRLEAADLAALDDPEGHYRARGGEVLVARVGGEVAGVIAMLPVHGGREVEMTKLGVTPAARGRGAGRALIRASVAWARAHGAEAVVLESNARLQAALHLYEAEGFEHLPLDPASEYERADVRMRLLL